MLAMAVHYLTGRAVGKRYNSHVDADWPPEPGRLYYALVNALHAGGNLPNERGSLLWLETRKPPCLSFSDSNKRSAPVTFVPPNDVPTMPDRRKKRERRFPSITPESPLVYFTWRDADPSPELLEGLRSVASRVTYLGHSSSLVSVSLCNNPPS